MHLYNYLLAGAYTALREPELPLLVDTAATVEFDLVGPFQVRIPLQLAVDDGHAHRRC